MVRNFFEPLEDDIKDIIAPPMKALIVVPEGEGEGAVDEVDAGEEVLKAIPIEEDIDPGEPDEVLRAIPIDDDEEVGEGYRD
jgi:hypothetical protein